MDFNTMFRRAAVCAGLAVCAGCFNMQSAPLARGGGDGAFRLPDGSAAAEHAVVANSGWYLFNRWPLVCGNMKPGAWFPFVFFRDNVDENLLQGCLVRYADDRACDVHELNLINRENVLYTTFFNIPVPLAYVFVRREMQYSGVFVKRPAPPPAVPGAAPAADAAARREMREQMRQLLDNIPDGGGTP